VFAIVNVRDRRVFLINKLQMDNLTPSSDACVKVFVIELDREPQLLGVKADG
jgi:hypothetical protein